MPFAAITSHIDIAQVVLYTFWLFFFGLILYLRYEDQREGYPLENENGPTNRQIFYPPPNKPFALEGGGVRESNRADRKDLNYDTMTASIGDPVLPKGDPIDAGMGSGSWSNREDVPDVTFDGHLRIVPLRVATDFGVNEEDPDPRGYEVVGSDRVVAGKVVDLWVDRAEFVHRYMEVELNEASGAAGKHVLLPVGFMFLDSATQRIYVDSLRAAQFHQVPGTKKPDEVTRLEEDKIVAAFGAGYLYSSPQRAEPLL